MYVSSMYVYNALAAPPIPPDTKHAPAAKLTTPDAMTLQALHLLMECLNRGCPLFNPPPPPQSDPVLSAKVRTLERPLVAFKRSPPDHHLITT